MDVYQFGIAILLVLAVSDLVVGVSNDAVNFLNSAIGSRVASRRVIMAIASAGILAGVTFSSGMMEVARKGIFHPQYFTMPELLAVFLAVMLTDIILLDLFNTFGMPTSTTVSIVFELLGAAVAVALVKIQRTGQSVTELVDYINTGKALAIISGILLSVVIAFAVGAAVQYVSRLLFTFDFEKRMRRYGALWGGVALSSITYFILIKGSKGASFLTDEVVAWIKSNTGLILLLSFVLCAASLQILMWVSRLHVLRVVVLAGTFALAMAFAANDLVNFVGVPLAGMSSYQVADGSGALLTQTMEALRQPVRANTFYLLLAGGVMVVTLWLSRKARSVTRTEVSLGRQDEGFERFESSVLSQRIVRIVASLFEGIRRAVPAGLRRAVGRRFHRAESRLMLEADGTAASFDLVRASVNLMVAAALISLATSLKLPLSTTYVTFMVAMGTSLSDQAWGRESAVFRVTGVLTVIGGWFFTAFMAFTVSSVFALAISFGRAPAALAILGIAVLSLVHNHRRHRSREEEEQATDVFNLRRLTDPNGAIHVTFEHAGIYLQEVRSNLDAGFEGLFQESRQLLRDAKKRQKKIQQWSNIIIANIFKVLRLMQTEDVANTQTYANTISTLQEITDSQRDIVLRAYTHVVNHHAGLLPAQIEELQQVRSRVTGLLDTAVAALMRTESPDVEALQRDVDRLQWLVDEFNQNQITRIQDNTSKTRLSILFYGFMWDSLKIADHTLELLQIFRDPLQPNHRNGPARPSPVLRGEP